MTEPAGIIEFFYRTHDPTTVNKQGADSGSREFSMLRRVKGDRTSSTEYRSAIFYNTPEQKAIAERVTKAVQDKHFTPTGKRIVTEIVEAGPWWHAEDYHQLYLFKNPDGYQCPTHRLHW